MRRGDQAGVVGYFPPAGTRTTSASTATGPGYDGEEALQLIRERYEVANETLRYTLPRLLADETSHATIVRLRDAGWLDWQILVVLVNAAMNWRMQHGWHATRGRRPVTDDAPGEGTGNPAVTGDSARGLPDDAIDMHTYMQTLTVARRWDLHGRQEAPGEEAMRDLLIRRYQYAVDDIPHRDLLDCLDEDGNLRPVLEQDAKSI